MRKAQAPERLSQGHAAAREENLSFGSMAADPVGCTNSVIGWIRPICSEIVFMYPTR